VQRGQVVAEVVISILSSSSSSTIDNRGLNARWCLTPFLLSLPTAAYLGQRGLTYIYIAVKNDDPVESRSSGDALSIIFDKYIFK